MSDVFISYSSKDRAAVEPIVRQLQEHRVDMFWDQLIAPGESFQDRVERQLSEAKAVLVVWSQHAAESEWVRSEAQFAVTHKKYVSMNLGDRFNIPAPFDKFHTFRWRDDGGNEVVKQLLVAFANRGVLSSGTKPPAPPIISTSERRSRGFAFISHVAEDVPVVSNVSQFLKSGNTRIGPIMNRIGITKSPQFLKSKSGCLRVP